MVKITALRTSALAFAALVLLHHDLLAQAGLEWTAMYGPTPAAPFRSALDAAVDTQGNVHVAMWFQDNTVNLDVEITKHSPTGALLWSRIFDAGARENPSGIQIASNGDVCVVGISENGQNDGIVLRYDAAGNLIWSTVFAAAPGNGPDGYSALAIDAQYNIIAAGTATDAQGQTDMLVQAYSPLGNLLWDTRIHGGGGIDYVSAIVIDPSGAIFVAGVVNDPNLTDPAIAKLAPNGALQWLRVLPSAAPGYDGFFSLASDRQGGVIAGGYIRFPGGPQFSTNNGLVAHCDGAGNYSWVDVYPRGTLQSLTSSVAVDDGGVFWALHVYDFAGTSDVLVTRISPAGVRLSTLAIPSADYGVELAAGDAGQMFLCALGGGLLWGPGQHAIVAQLDTTGALNWQRTFTPGITGVKPLGLHLAPNSRAVIQGFAPTNLNDVGSVVMQIDLSESPQGFCTGKPNSLGCVPRTVFTGMSSASASSGFAMQVERARNQKPGLFVYSVSGQAATPFGGGLLCVSAPVRRTSSVHSGGGPAAIQDCSGIFSIDMNAFASGALGGSPAPALTIPGTHVWLQAVGRDSGFPAPNNLSLSSGLTYAVLP